jgi:hypothetical protein
MARTPNANHSVRVTITASAQVGGYLDDLIGVGIYGQTQSEVAKTLVASGIERLIKDGVLQIKRPPSSSGQVPGTGAAS